MDGLAKISMNARKRSTTVVSMHHALIPSGSTTALVLLDFRGMDGLAKTSMNAWRRNTIAVNMHFAAIL